MRISLKSLLIVGFGAALLIQGAPTASAADLDVTRVKRHHRSVVLRDYDGSLVVRRVHRMVVQTMTARRWSPRDRISTRSNAVRARTISTGNPYFPIDRGVGPASACTARGIFEGGRFHPLLGRANPDGCS